MSRSVSGIGGDPRLRRGARSIKRTSTPNSDGLFQGFDSVRGCLVQLRRPSCRALIQVLPLPREPDRAGGAEGEGSQQIDLRTYLPQERPAKSRYGHDHIADKIVETEHAGLATFGCELHDQR